jgi:3-oxoacyl-[acyl-carrier protein] reductase
MDLGLSDKAAVVLGASSGLGFAIAERLAHEGARVFAGAREGERLEKAVQALRAISAGASALPLNLLDKASVAAAETAIAKIAPDILVCNNGGPPPGSAAQSKLEDWRHQFDAMVLHQISIIRAALPKMQDRGWGRILIVGSSGVVEPIANLVISNALRSALIAFAKTLATEVGRSGVRVNVILPGRIATDRVAQLDEGAAERQKISVADVKKKSMDTIPLGRYGNPSEFADVAAFIVSERASYMTGQITRVDGGLLRSI